MPVSTPAEDISGFIQVAVKDRIQTIVKEECDKAVETAQEHIHKRVHKEIDNMALNVMRHYEVSSMNDVLTIRVHKELPKA